MYGWSKTTWETKEVNKRKWKSSGRDAEHAEQNDWGSGRDCGPDPTINRMVNVHASEYTTLSVLFHLDPWVRGSTLTNK